MRNVEKPAGVTFIEDVTKVLKENDELKVRVVRVKGVEVEMTQMEDDPTLQKKPLSEYKVLGNKRPCHTCFLVR